MSAPHPRITYAGPSSLLDTPLWPHLHTALSLRFPLRNLHWKPSNSNSNSTTTNSTSSSSSMSKSAIRTVQELQVDLVPLVEGGEEQGSQVPASLLEKPLLNLYFVACEDNDTYKTHLRKQIKDWLSTVSQRRNQEWLLVLLVRPGTTTGTRLFQQLKSTMLDRLKSDFNTAKRDRCVQLTWSLAIDEPAGWADLILKLKEGIVAAFDAHVAVREEEVRRSEGQRLLPGWNFCTFFVLKESLALSFEGMNLLDDALLQYDELESSFYQVLKEKNLSWFGKLGGTDPADDSLPLLSTSKKPYRDLLLSNTISVFDFRCYLMARQSRILGEMGRVSRLMRKVGAFVGGFEVMLEEESKNTFPEFFLQSWVFSSALSVVDQCQAWAREVTLDANATIAFNAAVGELLELARHQLDKIGMRVGHLPPIDPFILSSPSPPPTHPSSHPSSPHAPNKSPQPSSTPPSTSGISNQTLISAIHSLSAFDALYISLTKRAIDAFVSSKRKRFALRLHFSLAVLDSIRDRLPSAQTAYKSLPPHYTHAHWASIESLLLLRSADAHRQSQSQSHEWIADVLALLKSYITMEQMDADVDKNKSLEAVFQTGGSREVYFGQVMEDLRGAGEELEEELRVKHHPAFVLVSVAKTARHVDNRDGSHVDVVIQNNLPCDVRLGSLEAEFSGRDDDQITFSSQTPLLRPGRTTITLFCPSPASGLFTLVTSSFSLSRIIFYQELESKDPEETRRRTVRLPEDYACVEMLAGPPRSLHLDQAARVLVTLTAGRNHIRSASFNFRDLLSNASFLVSNFALEPASEANSQESVTSEGNSLVFANIPAGGRVEVAVPYYGSGGGSGISLLIEGTYRTEAEPDLVRSLRRIRHVPVTFPMAVNVEEFFRGTSVFLKFTVSSDGYQYLRIMDAQLKGDTPGYSIHKSRPSARQPVIVSPGRQASFLFHLQPTGPADRELPEHEQEPLRIVISYATLWDEIEEIARMQIRSVIEARSLEDHEGWLQQTVTVRLREDPHRLETYATKSTLILPSRPWTDAVQSYPRGNGVEGTLVEALEQISEALRAPNSSSTSRVSTFSIPMDIPVKKILNSVRISIPDGSTLFAGQPVSATLSISSRIVPNGSTGQAEQYRMRFDVPTDFTTWLVSGQKRGEFIAKDKESIDLPLTLVPVRHGALFLPQVSVYPVSEGLEELSDGRLPELPSSDTYQTNAAERVVVFSRITRTTYVISLPTGEASELGGDP